MARGRKRDQEVSDTGSSSAGMGSAGTSAEHNVKARREIINECASQMLGIISERQELNERAGEIRERLKNAGIDNKAFMFALRVQQMGDDRDTYLDGLRENFKALGIGQQGSLFLDPEQDEDKDLRPNFLRETTATHEAAGTA